jgi:hypothetical protein
VLRNLPVYCPEGYGVYACGDWEVFAVSWRVGLSLHIDIEETFETPQLWSQCSTAP